MAFTTENVFINLPVKDLEKTKAFFSAIGFAFNPQFTNELAACMILGKNMYAMLLTHGHFAPFTKKPIADATKATEVLIAFSASSRAEVDEIVQKAVAAGGKLYAEPADHGFMYQHSFEDLDGHQWEIAWMDPSAIMPTE